jgi:hypothetical protein
VGWKQFFDHPIDFMEERLSDLDKNKEQLKVKDEERSLDIDGILWLIMASGKRDLVNEGLISIAKLKPAPDLVERCLENEIPGLLIRRAYLHLPGRDHDSWRDPNPRDFGRTPNFVAPTIRACTLYH